MNNPIVPFLFAHGDRRAEAYEEVNLGRAYLVPRFQSPLLTTRSTCLGHDCAPESGPERAS